MGKIILLFFALVSTFCFAAPEVLLDQISAVVEGAPILSSAVKKKVVKGPLVTISEYPSLPTDPEADRALNDAINLELILKSAEESGIEVTDEEVDKEIDKFLKNQGADRNGLKQFLQQQGRNFQEYQEDFATQLIVRKFQQRTILPSVKVTDEDVRQYYAKRGGAISKTSKVDIYHVFFKAQGKGNNTPRLANNAYSELQAGADFFDIVKKYSQDQATKGQQGFMGTFEMGELHASLRSTVAGLEPESFSKPVRSPIGFHILYVGKRSQSNQGDEFKRVKPQLENELKSLEAMKQTQLWLLERRTRAKININKS